MREVLFICTGNYYRSRFAEAVFNHLAKKAGIPWRAFSRGLAIHLADGDLSPHSATALQERGIERSHTAPTRVSLAEADLSRASHIVALKRDEHHALMAAQFPAWADRITYWAVHDLDAAEPAQALAEIETFVGKLLRELDAQKPDPIAMLSRLHKKGGGIAPARAEK